MSCSVCFITLLTVPRPFCTKILDSRKNNLPPCLVGTKFHFFSPKIRKKGAPPTLTWTQSSERLVYASSPQIPRPQIGAMSGSKKSFPKYKMVTGKNIFDNLFQHLYLNAFIFRNEISLIFAVNMSPAFSCSPRYFNQHQSKDNICALYVL